MVNNSVFQPDGEVLYTVLTGELPFIRLRGDIRQRGEKVETRAEPYCAHPHRTLMGDLANVRIVPPGTTFPIGIPLGTLVQGGNADLPMVHI